MTEHVDRCIMEAVEAATGVEFNMDKTAEARLRLPARMKGGGIKSTADTRRPAFLGALLDILPRCVDRKAENGEHMPGYYAEQLTEEIGRGAFDQDGHRNEQFLRAGNIGPYPEALKEAWTTLRQEAMQNYNLREGSEQEVWGRMREGVRQQKDGTTMRNLEEREKMNKEGRRK